MNSSFHGAFLKNEHRITDRKSIVICGAPRGGTSFAASVFLRLGVPFKRNRKDGISPRHEHNALRAAFEAEDHDTVRRIIADFSSLYPVWGWKFPAIERRFAAISEMVPNPHFVVIFKEPLSVAVRSGVRRSKNPINVLQQVVAVHQRLASIAATTEHPLLLISYDKAITCLPDFLATAASFAGITSYDEAAVIAGIQGDGRRYFGNKQSESSVPALSL